MKYNESIFLSRNNKFYHLQKFNIDLNIATLQNDEWNYNKWNLIWSHQNLHLVGKISGWPKFIALKEERERQ